MRNLEAQHWHHVILKRLLFKRALYSDCTMAAASGWRKTGMFKGIGLPVPSGKHRVGCVDVMPLCPGEESGLLFRLYYPTEATPDSGYHYPPWLPNKLYAKGYMLFKRYSSLVAGALGSLVTTFCGKLTSPLLSIFTNS